MAHLIIWNSFGFNDHSLVRPVGPHQLACWLSNFGYEVKVIDFCNFMTPLELASLTAKFIDKDTVAIGASNTFWDDDQISRCEPEWVMRARGFVEKKYPKLSWILGGSRNSYLSMKLIQKWITFTGYSEDSLLKFLDEKTSRLILRPAFDIQKNRGHYTDGLGITSSEVLNIELSRGCQFKCRFCRFAELGKRKNTYIRDYNLIEEELLSNYERFGTTRYAMMDDTANESTEKLEALAEIAQRLPFKLEWVGYVRLDLIGTKPYTADLLVQSGLRGCYFGIESFHPTASLMVGKGWNGKHGKDFLLKLKERWKEQVIIELGFIVGLRGESEKDLDETQQWCIDNNIDQWRWHSLSISKQPEQLWKSDFDINYGQYGYSFPPGENYHWVSDDWNSVQATNKSTQLNNDVKDTFFINPWHAAMLGGLGYDFDELFKTKISDLDYIKLKSQVASRVKNYINYQMKL